MEYGLHRMADIKPKFQLRMVEKTDCQAYTGEPNEDGTITICQEETKIYHKDEDGTIHRDGYEVVNHTYHDIGAS